MCQVRSGFTSNRHGHFCSCKTNHIDTSLSMRYSQDAVKVTGLIDSRALEAIASLRACWPKFAIRFPDHVAYGSQ